MLGQALELAKGAPWDVMTRWAMEYGWIYQFSMFGNTNIVISDPAYMKEVMRSKVLYVCSNALMHPEHSCQSFRLAKAIFFRVWFVRICSSCSTNRNIIINFYWWMNLLKNFNMGF